MDDERADDLECKQQYKERWNRMSSDDLQKNLRDQLLKYEKFLQTSKDSDELVRKRFESSLPFIDALCASKQDLENFIPACSESSNLAKNDPVVKELKAYLAEVEKLKAQRTELLVRLKSLGDTDDIGPALLEAHSRKESNYEPIFERQLTRYEEIAKAYEAVSQKQVAIVKSISVIKM